MYNYSKDGITVASILDTRKAIKEGNFPIKIRVTYKRKRIYFSTGKALPQSDWESLPNSKTRIAKELREDIGSSFSIVKSNVEVLAEKGAFSFDALNLRLSRATGDTLNIALSAKIKKLTDEGRIGARDVAVNALKNAEKFGGQKISFESISVEWLKQYEKFLLKDKVHTTVGIYMREIRTVMNQARKAGTIKDSQYPFGKDKYEIKVTQGHKKALNLAQIGAIAKFDDGNKTTERYRDLWLFIYFCNGINVADLVKLKFKNIREDEIHFIRQKTELTSKTRKEIRVALTEEMRSIISKWGNKEKLENYIFPYLKGDETAEKRKYVTKDLTRRINKRLKLIGKELGIGDITTYVARHSFATVLKWGGANIAFIGESLGHNDLKTTESYLASFEKDERIKNASLLTRF